MSDVIPAAAAVDPFALGDKPVRTREVLRSLKKDPAALVSIIVLVLLALVALAAPLLSPHDPLQTYPDIGLGPQGQPLPPGTPGFLLGTDALGRDVLSRLIYGAQVSLVIGIVANGLATAFGVLVGIVAGYFGGVVEAVLMRITDVVISFPILLLCTALIAVTTRSTFNVIIVIALIYWTTLARIIRSMVVSLKEREFVVASQTLGLSHRSIMWRHILPHLVPAIIVYTTLGVASSILIESALSFLGIGVPIPSPSWGQMISDGSTYFQIAPWMLFIPGVCLILTVMAFNLVGDWLSDMLNSSTPTAR
ncbi:peptide ABC transporter permease [Subtercola boreus]|uniref:Peptide ABC transporter permease n=1 Tax=Subtercola boreus TaxID=120213 RepID=A0A3E0VPS5_9MICO|nr:ABC transporter permease [Subtercola boreus]RFA10857.1 peptide ABC transporter permease [Subtercola boreus]TQL55560.1 peptide/nickel transport system permease protein [Subtercola boreus]